jgi:hypothetical protein
MAWILLGTCVVVCPLLMGGMMLSMRQGVSGRRPEPRHVDDPDSQGESDG